MLYISRLQESNGYACAITDDRHVEYLNRATTTRDLKMATMASLKSTPTTGAILMPYIPHLAFFQHHSAVLDKFFVTTRGGDNQVEQRTR